MKPRWQRRKPAPSHADDWLMTYADMITLLLCFFAVFVSVAIAKKETAPVAKPVPTPPPVVAPVTQPPPAPPIEFHPALLPGLAREAPPDADAADESKTAPAGPPAGETLLPTLQPVEHPVAKTDMPVVPEDKPPPVAVVADEDPTAFQDMIDRLKQGNANVEQKGDRLTTMEMSSAAFFGSGSATLSDSGKSVLRDVAANIKSDKFRGYEITVEGHTDDTPIHTAQFPSNWELSTARAAAVVQFFIEQGVPAQRLRAAGYADTFPKVPNRDAAGNPIPANRAANRRVVIKLEKIDKAG